MEGQPGRQAGWARILVQNAPILVENDRFATETAKFLLGAATLSVRNTAPSSVGSTQQAPHLCSRQQTPLVAPYRDPLFATADSSGGSTALSSVGATGGGEGYIEGI